MEKLLQSFRISRQTFCTILREPLDALAARLCCMVGRGRSRRDGRDSGALASSKVAGLPRTFKVYGLAFALRAFLEGQSATEARGVKE